MRGSWNLTVEVVTWTNSNRMSNVPTYQYGMNKFSSKTKQFQVLRAFCAVINEVITRSFPHLCTQTPRTDTMSNQTCSISPASCGTSEFHVLHFLLCDDKSYLHSFKTALSKNRFSFTAFWARVTLIKSKKKKKKKSWKNTAFVLKEQLVSIMNKANLWLPLFNCKSTTAAPLEKLCYYEK